MEVSEAKKICKNKWGHLPRMGYEMLVEEGVRPEEIWLNSKGGIWCEGDSPWGKRLGTRNFSYRKWLRNRSGTFDVWEWSGLA